jgi:hypothetical protein
MDQPKSTTMHRRVMDHMPTATAYQRFNKRIAMLLTKYVGTMTCFWIFTLLSLFVLPSVLYAMGVIHKGGVIPTVFLGFGFELLMTWVLSTFLQLILLPALMVGQNLQNAAADARSAKQFADTESIMDTVNLNTDGGLQILDAKLNRIMEKLESLEF